MHRFASLLLATSLGLAAVAGCSSSRQGAGPAEPTRSDELQEVATMLRDYTSAAGRGPKSARDLARYQGQFTFGHKPVQSGDIVIVWGARMGGEGGGGSDGVIAYERQAAAEGGWVLLANGTVKQLTALEFKAAPKAKP
jgi:hypothetical protein